ncbi:hypothetical protein ACOME3_001501 [Neoechinorhynchus agilis]
MFTKLIFKLLLFNILSPNIQIHQANETCPPEGYHNYSIKGYNRCTLDNDVFTDGSMIFRSDGFVGSKCRIYILDSESQPKTPESITVYSMENSLSQSENLEIYNDRRLVKIFDATSPNHSCFAANGHTYFEYESQNREEARLGVHVYIMRDGDKFKEGNRSECHLSNCELAAGARFKYYYLGNYCSFSPLFDEIHCGSKGHEIRHMVTVVVLIVITTIFMAAIVMFVILRTKRKPNIKPEVMQTISKSGKYTWD